MLQALEEYRASQDSVGRFLSARPQLLPNQTAVSAAELYQAYKAWCESHQERPLGMKRFGEGMARTAGVTKTRGNQGVVYEFGG